MATRVSRRFLLEPFARGLRSFRLAALALCAALAALSPGPARARSEGLMDRVGSVLDGVPRWLDFFGEKAEGLLGPGLGLGQGASGGFASGRDFDESYPVGAGARVSVSNEFGAGAIHVKTWNSQVVQVAAKIAVRADTADLAREICRSIEIRAGQTNNEVEIRTILPETPFPAGKPAIEVNYDVTIPRDAHLDVRNDLGDTSVTGVGGTLTVDSLLGAVEIRDAVGPVQVRSRGEFPLRADNLQQGGSFELYQARAEFSNVSGPLHVSNFRGSVLLRDLRPEVDARVVSESGPVYLLLTQDALPDLLAASVFGSIQSDLPLNHSTEGKLTIARNADAAARQHVELRTTFADIIIQRKGAEPGPAPANGRGAQPFKEMTSQTAAVPEGTPLQIQAVAGDVMIEGVDQDQVRIRASKYVRITSRAKVEAALQALRVEVDVAGGQARITTAVTDNMEALGCTAWRVDLQVECPRTSAIHVEAADGLTSISGVGAPVTVRQGAGSIAVEHVKAELDLVNAKGDIQVTSCAGPVQASTRHGNIQLKEIYGTMTTACTQGKTIIESPFAGFQVRNTGGDVRILSLDAVSGDYDVVAEQGNISILLPPETDATLTVTAENGTVHSAIPLTGNITKGLHEFIKAGAGPHRVTLQTRDGDILVN